MPPQRKEKKALLLVLLGVAMVSYSGPMVKGALMEGATPVTVAFLRMLMAGLLMLPLALKKDKEGTIPLIEVLRAPKRQLLFGMLAALFLALHYFTWMTSLNSTSTFASVALVCTQPLFVAGFSGLLLHEPMAKSARPGALMSLAGALLIGASGLNGQGENLLGDALALVGAVAMAGHWLVGRYARRSLNALGYTVYVYLLTACFLGLLLPMSGGIVLPGNAIWYLLGLVLGSTLLGHAVFTYALGTVSAHVVSFALLGEPVGAMVFAYFMFGERPGPLLLLGGGVVLLGLFIYLRAASANEEKVNCKT